MPRSTPSAGDRMPEPGDLIMASPHPGRCFPMLQCRQQATRHEAPDWNGLWRDGKGRSWYVSKPAGRTAIDHQRGSAGPLNSPSHQASNLCEWESKAARRPPRRPNAASILPEGWVRARWAVSATAAHVFNMRATRLPRS